jgi:hypothetical protein
VSNACPDGSGTVQALTRIVPPGAMNRSAPVLIQFDASPVHVQSWSAGAVVQPGGTPIAKPYRPEAYGVQSLVSRIDGNGSTVGRETVGDGVGATAPTDPCWSRG